jgi:hypothetical protein
MASEILHVFGVLGTQLAIQIGNCGALADEMIAGDLFSASEAYCGEGPRNTTRPEKLRFRRHWILESGYRAKV